MHFVKYHGLGNDFIILEPETASHPGFSIDAALARALCHRGMGIGADGVMLCAAPRVADADVRMDLVNSDGSLPEMCGNGIRCLVKYAVDVAGFRRNPLRVETPAGVLACAWREGAAGEGVVSVSVDMSRPRFDFAGVPFDVHHAALREDGLATLALDDRLGARTVVGLPVNTGNPHFVVFGDASRERALSDGPGLERHPAFPEKANIEMTEVLGDTHLRVTVWERGCGLTLACGTGATAATAAAVRRGLVRADVPVQVDLPGGSLTITVASDFSSARMDGPVAYACRGEVPVSV